MNYELYLQGREDFQEKRDRPKDFEEDRLLGYSDPLIESVKCGDIVFYYQTVFHKGRVREYLVSAIVKNKKFPYLWELEDINPVNTMPEDWLDSFQQAIAIKKVHASTIKFKQD